MIIIEQQIAGVFRTGEVWFAEYPEKIKGYHSLTFRQCKTSARYAGFKQNKFSTIILDLTLNEEQLWDNLSPKSCRYKINRATREGIVVCKSDDFDEFDKLYKDFANHKGLSAGGYSLAQLKQHGTLFFAEYQGEKIAGQVYFENKTSIRLILGGSQRFHDDALKRKMIGFANRLLVWEVVKYAKSNGLVEYDFGGFYTGEDSAPQKENINNFKKSFGGLAVNHYDYSKTFSVSYRILRLLFRFVKY